MIYDTRKQMDVLKLRSAVDRAIESGKPVEFKEKVKRTLNQNSYLHLVIALVADEIGVTPEYCKAVYFKMLVNPDIFLRNVDDRIAGRRTYILSSAEVEKEDMSRAIERFVNWARHEMDMIVPSPGDSELLNEIQIELGRKRLL